MEIEDEKKDTTPVTKGVPTKKNWFGRIAESIVSKDAPTIGSFIVWDVLVPLIKDGIREAIVGGVDILLGDGRTSSRGVSRRDYSRRERVPLYREENASIISRRGAQNRQELVEILINSKEAAETIIERMEDFIDRFGAATVEDYYSLVGYQADYPMQRWGWTSMRSVEILRTRDGYVLDFPQPKFLDR